MDHPGRSGPVVVCVESDHDLGLVVRCGAAMALQLNVGLYLAVVLVRGLDRELVLNGQEERDAEAVLDAAVALGAGSGIEISEGIWAARHWQDAVQQIVREVSASALVISWRARGPLRLLDIGHTLLKDLPCPVIMAGQPRTTEAPAAWPPRWLVKAQLQLPE